MSLDFEMNYFRCIYEVECIFVCACPSVIKIYRTVTKLKIKNASKTENKIVNSLSGE